MIENLSQLKDTIKKCRGTWAWVGQRGIDAFTILGFVPVDTVFCCDYGEDYSNLWQSESLFSVEKNLGRRENWGNQDLEKLWEGETRERIDRYAEKVKVPIITVG